MNNLKPDAMKELKPTCGPFYKAALEKYAKTPEEMHIFAAGFVSGQAEKVYLGACRAAMFRPSQDRHAMLLEIVKDVTERYGLLFVDDVGEKKEIWICRSEWANYVLGLINTPENSELWHQRRAFLCGIPHKEIDPEFHLREGHGERCD
jgi:hypothetical protein